jgi:hypothetical protein
MLLEGQRLVALIWRMPVEIGADVLGAARRQKDGGNLRPVSQIFC